MLSVPLWTTSTSLPAKRWPLSGSCSGRLPRRSSWSGARRRTPIRVSCGDRSGADVLARSPSRHESQGLAWSLSVRGHSCRLLRSPCNTARTPCAETVDRLQHDLPHRVPRLRAHGVLPVLCPRSRSCLEPATSGVTVRRSMDTRSWIPWCSVAGTRRRVTGRPRPGHAESRAQGAISHLLPPGICAEWTSRPCRSPPVRGSTPAVLPVEKFVVIQTVDVRASGTYHLLRKDQ